MYTKYNTVSLKSEKREDQRKGYHLRVNYCIMIVWIKQQVKIHILNVFPNILKLTLFFIWLLLIFMDSKLNDIDNNFPSSF